MHTSRNNYFTSTLYSTPKAKLSIQERSTVCVPTVDREITKSSRLRIKLKALTQECIIRKLTYSLTVDLSIRYYQLITEIHTLLGREIKGIKFETVELFSDTGYPLAVSPYKYLQTISEWNLEQNAMLYVCPKNIPVTEISCKQQSENSYSIKVAIESTSIILSVMLCHTKLFCLELKEILALHLHLPTDVIELHILFVDTQIKEIPKDQFEVEMDSVFKEKLLISICISEHWKEDSYLGAFSTNLYKSCLSQNNATDWDCFNCLLLYLSKEQSGKKREDLLAILGLLRRISCSPPLVYAMYRLLTGRTLCMPHRVAINEGILTTLSFLMPDRDPCIHHFSALWMYLERNTQQKHSNTEVYETLYISKHTRDMPRDQETQRLLQAFPLSEDTIVTWSDCPSAHEPFVHSKLSERDFSTNLINQRFPLKHPIALYKQYLDSGIDYGLLRPISHKLSSHSVFLGSTKGRYGYFDFFDPHEGNSISYIPHDVITYYPLLIKNPLSYHKIIIILDISGDMKRWCREYTSQQHPNEPNKLNLISTSLDMAIWIIELLTDLLIQMGSTYLLGIILISNDHELTNGFCVLQTPTLEYVRILRVLREYVDTHPPLQGNFKKLPQGIVVNAFFHIFDNFVSDNKDLKLQVFLLTNHLSNEKFYGSWLENLPNKLTHCRVTLNALILSDYKSEAFSGLCRKSKGKYLDQRDILRQDFRFSREKLPSHYLLEYYSLFTDTLVPLELHVDCESYNTIHSTYKKKLVDSGITLDMVQGEKQRFTDLSVTKKIPNLIEILRQISSYSKSPNPYCKLFSIQDDVQHWLCIFQGPDNTPFQNSVLFLEIRFGIFYPQKPPEFRFLSSYFHPNIRTTGEVCHPILFEDYHPGVSLRQLMDSIYDLICSPVPSHAVRYKVMEIFSFHRERYDLLVNSFLVVYKFKRSFPDCIQKDSFRSKSTTPNLKLSHPVGYLCPLTKELFDQPVITPDGKHTSVTLSYSI